MGSSASERIYKHRRAALVTHLRERGVNNERVLRAIGRVPRHQFVEPAFRERAYKDEALPIGQNQTISQPFTVAYQTRLLDPAPGSRVLEVGTGSGYQASVLCEMDVKVFSIERHAALLHRARHRLRTLGYEVRLRCGDGTKGWPAFAPYDGILVTAGAPTVPDPLLNQLSVDGGRLVMPVGPSGQHVMHRVTRRGPERYTRSTFDTFRFVPLVSDEA